jgi:polygalacturonan/rhamnogalacturonan transport system permease protein
MVGNYTLLLLLAATMIYPFLNLLAISLSSPGYVLKGEVALWPKGFTLDTYKVLINANEMIRSLLNTVYITIVGTAISLVMTLVLAYPLSRDYILVKGAVLRFVLFTILFNGGMIPNYILIRNLGLLDTYWALIIPGSISAYNLIIMVNFFKAVPKELEEAGIMDGMSDLQILGRIFIPLSMHAVATQALFYSVGKWNIFFQAVMYINDMKKYPIQVMLRQIIMLDEAIGTASSDAVLDMPPETKKAAAIFFSVVPILCVYPFLQRYFISGVVVGSIKG